MKDAPWYHYPVAAIALLWFLLSAIDYTLTKLQFAPYLDAFSPDQIAYFTNMPLYVDIAWALNVWIGFSLRFSSGAVAIRPRCSLRSPLRASSSPALV